MSPFTSSNHDVRQYVRFAAKGYAVVHGADFAMTAEVMNVSLGGVLLALDGGALPRSVSGVDLDLRLAGCDRRFQVAARVLRWDARGSLLALAFVDADSDLEDAIADVGLDTVEAADSPRVLLVDSDEARRRRCARLLRMSGCSPLEATTPLEAIRTCEESALPLTMALIVDGAEMEGADELATFLSEHDPELAIGRIDPSCDLLVDMLQLFARSARGQLH